MLNTKKYGKALRIMITNFIGVTLHSELQYNTTLSTCKNCKLTLTKYLAYIFKNNFCAKVKANRREGNIIDSLLKASIKGNRAVWHQQNPESLVLAMSKMSEQII